jgi:solute carrier family 25 (mitochondrial carnitine/acylcarnitine transporter), member 20/29
MSADFWAGYLSGAIGIVIGNPLDLIKVRLQAGEAPGVSTLPNAAHFETTSSLVRGLSSCQLIPFPIF